MKKNLSDNVCAWATIRCAGVVLTAIAVPLVFCQTTSEGQTKTEAVRSGGLVITPSATSASIDGTVTLTANRPVNFALATGSLGKLTTIDSKHATYTAPSSIPVQTSVGGCPTGPNDSILNTPVTSAAVDARSGTWLAPVARIGISPEIAFWHNVVTDPKQPMIMRKFGYSQPGGPFPEYTGMFGREAGQQHNDSDNNDHHTISVLVNHQGVAGSCQWYETYNDIVPSNSHAKKGCQDGTNTCNAASGVTYSAMSYATFAHGSTNIAGTSINLVGRLDEIKNNAIHHPMEFTLAEGRVSGSAFQWPAVAATGWGSATTIPLGTRFRLKASTAIPASYSQYAKNVLNGWKNYGLILSDFASGSAAVMFDSDVTEDLSVMKAVAEAGKGLTMGDFEAVDVDDLKLNNMSTEVNPANPEKLTPVGFAYVTATEITPEHRRQNSVGLGIALRGVAIGVPHAQLTVLASAKSYTYQLPFWVTGTNDQTVKWTITSGPGSVTSGGLYTVPRNAAIKAITPVVLTGTSAADPNAKVTQYINLLPFSADGNFRMIMNTANEADNSSPSPFTWWAAAGLQIAYPEFTGHDYPNWTNVSGPEQNIRQFGLQSAASSDIHIYLVLPNGNYKTRLLFAKECENYCKATAIRPADTIQFLEAYHTPEFINVNGQMDSWNYQWGAMVNYMYSTAWDYYAPAHVTSNTLDYWQGGIVPFGVKRSPGPMLSAIEIIPDLSEPHIAIDTGTESWDYVTGKLTRRRVLIKAGSTVRLSALGWYMSNSVIWSVAGGGSISAGGLYTAPAATDKDQSVTVIATSSVDKAKTAAVTLTIPTNTSASPSIPEQH